MEAAYRMGCAKETNYSRHSRRPDAAHLPSCELGVELQKRGRGTSRQVRMAGLSSMGEVSEGLARIVAAAESVPKAFLEMAVVGIQMETRPSYGNAHCHRRGGIHFGASLNETEISFRTIDQ